MSTALALVPLSIRTFEKTHLHDGGKSRSKQPADVRPPRSVLALDDIALFCSFSLPHRPCVDSTASPEVDKRISSRSATMPGPARMSKAYASP